MCVVAAVAREVGRHKRVIERVEHEHVVARAVLAQVPLVPASPHFRYQPLRVRTLLLLALEDVSHFRCQLAARAIKQQRQSGGALVLFLPTTDTVGETNTVGKGTRVMCFIYCIVILEI